MSYEKVKTITIKNEQVFINCASNNVRPLHYVKEEFPRYSLILREEGRQALDVALLKGYEEGNLQNGINKYSKALKVLKYVFTDEYKQFDWRNRTSAYGSPEDKKDEERKESKEFDILLLKALNYKDTKKRFVISKQNGNENIYAKITERSAIWKYKINQATKFMFEQEAKDRQKSFSNSENWNISEVQK